MPNTIFCLSAVIALAALAAPAQAQRFEYSPGTAQYRVDVHSTGVVGQGATQQQVGYDTEQRMTVTLAKRAGDTLGLSITLDSVTGKLPNGAPIDASSMLGLRLRAALSPVGRLYAREGVTGPGVQNVGDFADELFRFLPVVPSVLGPGTSWTDTVATPMVQMGTPLSRSIITTYRVVSDTTLNGEHAWRVTRASVATVTGTSTAMGQSIQFQANGAGSGELYLGRSGRYLGANLRDSLTSKATVGSQGTSFTNTQTQVTTIALVR